MAWLQTLLRTTALACALLVTFATAASGAQFSLVPDADLGNSGANDVLKPVAGCASGTNVNRFDAIDEDVDSFAGSPCTEYVYGDTPGTGALTVYQDFRLSDPPAGAYNVNSLDVRFASCTTSQDPTVTISLYHGAGILIDSRSFTSFNTCGSYGTHRADFRDFSVTQAQLVTAYVRFSVTKPAGITSIIRLAALNVDGTSCLSNLCGTVSEDITASSLPWSRCPGAAVVTVRVNGINPQTVACDANGEFNYTGGAVAAGDVVTAYLTDAGAPTQRGVTYFRAGGTGNSLHIFRDHTHFETANGTSLTNAHVNFWDGGNDAAWIPVASDGTNLTEVNPTTLLPAQSNANGTYRPGGNVTASALVTRGVLKADSNTITLTSAGDNSTCSLSIGSRNPYCRNGASMDIDTSTLRLTGNGQIGLPSQTFWNLVHAPSAGSHSLTSNIDVSNDLTLGGGAGNAAWTTAAMSTITVGRDMTIASGSSFTGAGSQTIIVGRHFTGAGLLDLTSTSGEVQMRGTTAVRNFGPTVAGTTWRMPGLEVSTPGAASEVEVTTGGAGDILVNDDVDVGQVTDTNVTTLDLNAFDRTFIVGGRLDVTNRGTLLAPSSDTIEVRNEFDSDGTFTPNGGTVQVNTATDGISTLTYVAATTFANLTIQGGGTFQFDDADQTNVTGAFSVNGSSCVVPTRASLVSVTQGSRWELNVTGSHTVSNASIQDSAAILPLSGTLPSLDAGNNTGWSFTPGACLPQAPDSFLTETATQPVTVSDLSPEHSWINRAGYAVDQERTQVFTSPADDVRGLWRFDNSGAPALGAGTAALGPAGSWSTAGQANFGQQLALTGTNDSYARVPHNAGLTLANDFTVEAWIRPTGLSGGVATIIVQKGDAGCSSPTCNYSLEITNANGRLAGAVTSGGGQRRVSSPDGLATTLMDGDWHHVAMTMDATNFLRVYADGVLVGGPLNATGPADPSPNALGIGTTSTGSGLQMTGGIDDVRITARALSVDEIDGYYRTVRPHYTVMWDSSPTDAGAALASCGDDVRCADVTYGTGGGDLYLKNDGARYYVRSRVRSASDGVWSAWGSDWFEVVSSMTVGATPVVSIGPSLSGTDAVSTVAVTVTTDNFAGYTLTGQWNTAPLTKAGGATIPDFAPTVPNPTDLWTAGATLGFGVTVIGADTAGTPYPRLARWGTGTDTAANDFVNNKYAGLAVGSPILLHRRTTLDTGLDTIDLGLRGNVSSSQPAGSYSAQLVVTALANP